jgi:hypothetical protein
LVIRIYQTIACFQRRREIRELALRTTENSGDSQKERGLTETVVVTENCDDYEKQCRLQRQVVIAGSGVDCENRQ